MQTSSFAKMKRRNALSVLDLVRSRGEITRGELSRLTDLSPATVSRVIDELLKANLVSETGTQSSGRGRRPIGVSFNPGARWLVGISFERDCARILLTDLYGNAVTESAINFASSDSPAVIAALVSDHIKLSCKQLNANSKKLAAAGMAVPGPLGIDKLPTRQRSLLDYDEVRSLLSDKLRLPVTIETNTDAAAIAESLYGSAQGARIALLIRTGHQVRSSLVVDGRLVSGCHGLSGEIGHIAVPNSTNRCDCGKVGCINAIASASAILNRCAQDGAKMKNLDAVIAAAVRGDFACRNALSLAASAVGYGIATAINLLAPVVIVSGELTESEKLFTVPMGAAVEKHVLKESLPGVKISVSTLQNKAEPLGAALRAFMEHPILW